MYPPELWMSATTTELLWFCFILSLDVFFLYLLFDCGQGSLTFQLSFYFCIFASRLPIFESSDVNMETLIYIKLLFSNLCFFVFMILLVFQIFQPITAAFIEQMYLQTLKWTTCRTWVTSEIAGLYFWLYSFVKQCVIFILFHPYSPLWASLLHKIPIEYIKVCNWNVEKKKQQKPKVWIVW